ncbi:MAG: hypothetical protein S4CHLAM7_05150 [Chlamydiae bacterium]|nr:hypothetical protein [Chlamydiota bacterium]
MQSKLLSKIEKLLQRETLESYVLMVCNKSENNELMVEMTYDGDETLGCYMLENALSILNEKIKDGDELSQEEAD